MKLIDELLGPRVEYTIEDGEGGEFIVSVRPRRSGAATVRTTMASFRRPGQRTSQGFGCALWGLRLAARPGELKWRNPVAESSIGLTPTAARNALAWIDSIETRDGN